MVLLIKRFETQIILNTCYLLIFKVKNSSSYNDTHASVFTLLNLFCCANRRVILAVYFHVVLLWLN